MDTYCLPVKHHYMCILKQGKTIQLLHVLWRALNEEWLSFPCYKIHVTCLFIVDDTTFYCDLLVCSETREDTPVSIQTVGYL